MFFFIFENSTAVMVITRGPASDRCGFASHGHSMDASKKVAWNKMTDGMEQDDWKMMEHNGTYTYHLNLYSDMY